MVSCVFRPIFFSSTYNLCRVTDFISGKQFTQHNGGMFMCHMCFPHIPHWHLVTHCSTKHIGEIEFRATSKIGGSNAQLGRSYQSTPEIIYAPLAWQFQAVLSNIREYRGVAEWYTLSILRSRAPFWNLGQWHVIDVKGAIKQNVFLVLVQQYMVFRPNHKMTT